jgi:hypothetical protein
VAKKDARDNNHDNHDPDDDYLRDIHSYHNNNNNNNVNNSNYHGHFNPDQTYNGYDSDTYTGNGASYGYSGYPPAYGGYPSAYGGYPSAYSGYPRDYSTYNPADSSTSARAGPMTDPYLHQSTVSGRFTSGERRSEGEHLYDMQAHLDSTCDVLKKKKKHSKM